VARSFQTLQVIYWDGALKLTPEEKLVELFLMLNRNCECSGVQQVHPDTIREYTGLKQAEVDKALTGLEKKNRIGRCPVNWIIVLGKWEHQQRKTGQAETALQNSLETSPTQLQVLLANYLENHSKVQDDNKTSSSGEQLEGTCLGSREKGVVKREKTEESTEVSQRFKDAVAQLFPDVKESQVEGQARVLEEIERIDGKPLDELIPILQFGRRDDFWSSAFLSCAGLRKKRNGPTDKMKWEKIEAKFTTKTLTKPSIFPEHEL
jgi:hypothetical protein